MTTNYPLIKHAFYRLLSHTIGQALVPSHRQLRGRPLLWGGGLPYDAGAAEFEPSAAVLRNELFDQISSQEGSAGMGMVEIWIMIVVIIIVIIISTIWG